MRLRIAAFAVLAMPLGLGAASAQGDLLAMARAASANQLGVLEYCQAQGDTDGSGVAAEQSVIANLPAAPAGDSADAAAEALGKQGTVSANGSNVTLASIASQQRATVPALCKQLASSAVKSAAMQQSGGMISIPGSPAGGMPTLPPMPNMQTMPNTPAAPSTSQ